MQADTHHGNTRREHRSHEQKKLLGSITQKLGMHPIVDTPLGVRTMYGMGLLEESVVSAFHRVAPTAKKPKNGKRLAANT